MAGHDEDLIREHTFMLGRMDGKLDALVAGQSAIIGKADSIDMRLRAVEVRAARNGLIAGAIMGIGTSTLAMMIRQKLGLGGG